MKIPRWLPQSRCTWVSASSGVDFGDHLSALSRRAFYSAFHSNRTGVGPDHGLGAACRTAEPGVGALGDGMLCEPWVRPAFLADLIGPPRGWPDTVGQVRPELEHLDARPPENQGMPRRCRAIDPPRRQLRNAEYAYYRNRPLSECEL